MASISAGAACAIRRSNGSTWTRDAACCTRSTVRQARVPCPPTPRCTRCPPADPRPCALHHSASPRGISPRAVTMSAIPTVAEPACVSASADARLLPGRHESQRRAQHRDPLRHRQHGEIGEVIRTIGHTGRRNEGQRRLRQSDRSGLYLLSLASMTAMGRLAL